MRSLLFAASSLLLLGCPEPPPGVVTPGQTPSQTPQAPASGGEGTAPAATAEGTVADPVMDDGSRIPPGMRIEPPGFGLEEGEGVKLSGEVNYEGGLSGQLRVEILQVASVDSPPVLLHAVNLDKLGPWSVVAPAGLGQVDVMAYVDLDQNGPDGDEPQGVVEGGVTVGDVDIPNLALNLLVPEPPATPDPVEGEAPAEGAEGAEVPAEGEPAGPVGPPSADTPPEPEAPAVVE